MSITKDFEERHFRGEYIGYHERDVEGLLGHAQLLEAQNGELLEALKAIDQGFYSHRLTIKEAQAIARKAIAKAEGRE